MKNPSAALWACVKRVISYATSTKSCGNTYKSDKHSSFVPRGYSDVDWDGSKQSRKSTSGYVFLVAEEAISLKSRKQAIIATSSAEAECMALEAAAVERVRIARMFAFTIGMTNVPQI